MNNLHNLGSMYLHIKMHGQRHYFPYNLIQNIQKKLFTKYQSYYKVATLE